MIRRFLLLMSIAVAPAQAAAADRPDPAKLSKTIDSHLSSLWRENHVQATSVVDDPTFLRRASLDLIGRIPTVSETRDFLADRTPDKRTKLVFRLIDSGGHTRHMATFWRRTWLPQADTAEFARLADDFEGWVSVRLQDRVAFDQMVRELLTLSVETDLPAALAQRGAVNPAGFYVASEFKPENLAANSTRAFLGINLECAQCHDHPFSRWTREQFWQTAAFFARPQMDKGGKMMVAQLTIPNTKRTLTPELMDSRPLSWPEPIKPDTGRRLLAEWLTATDNKYFAKNAVNRLWSQFFGTALVEPLDDLSSEASSSGFHARLLNELAEAFVTSGYDLKFLTQALVLTKAYQLTAVIRGAALIDPRLFARMPIRGLTGEQLYDSLRTAAGLPAEREDTGRGQRSEARARFTAQFHVERTVSAERSIVQTLSMMNGRLTADLADPEKNPTLAGAVSAPFLDTKDKVETLYMAALGRKPSDVEADRLVKYVKGGGADLDSGRALADLFWALINSTEFNTNH